MPLRNKDPPNPQRQLMIKTKTCQRLIKEVKFYEAEVAENEQTLADMKSSNKDPYDIKKFEEVLGESHMMIPDSQSRLKQAVEDLFQFMEESRDQLSESDEWYTPAKELLAEQYPKTDGDEARIETNLDGLQDGEAF